MLVLPCHPACNCLAPLPATPPPSACLEEVLKELQACWAELERPLENRALSFLPPREGSLAQPWPISLCPVSCSPWLSLGWGLFYVLGNHIIWGLLLSPVFLQFLLFQSIFIELKPSFYKD